MLEALLRGQDEVLLLDEPDNYLDVPGKIWLEEQLAATPKTVCWSATTASCWPRVRSGSSRSRTGTSGCTAAASRRYAQARRDRIERLDELRRRWDEEHEKLQAADADVQAEGGLQRGHGLAGYQAAVTRLRKFEEAGPPELAPREQNVKMRLRGGRTGKRAVICEQLELTGLMRPFDLEVWYGERVAVLGSNGSGKSHFLRLLAGDDGRRTTGRRPARGQGRARACSPRRTRGPTWPAALRVEILMTEHAMLINEAMSALSRYELHVCARQPFGTLSGGQQARLQILLLELAGSTLLLLDEPTDNLDLASAEALQQGLESYAGTVVAVTHDRWFAKSFDRFLVFGADGGVYEAASPVWDETRVQRPR